MGNSPTKSQASSPLKKKINDSIDSEKMKMQSSDSKEESEEEESVKEVVNTADDAWRFFTEA